MSAPPDTLWRLSGSEVFDLSGPLAIGADIGGRLVDPVIRGSLRTQNARLESAVTGMIIDGLGAEARFSGPQLIFTPHRRARRRAAARSAASGLGHLLRRAHRCSTSTSTPRQALLLNRDDIAARVTGPLAHPLGRARRDDLRQPPARPRAVPLGRASAAASVPRLQVRHTGRDPGRSHRGRRPARRGGSTSSVAGRDLRRARARHREPLEHRPADRRHRRRAALHRPRRPGPRRL